MRSVTIVNGGITCTIIEDPVENEDIWGLATLIRQAVVGVGFHPDNVDDLISDDQPWNIRRDVVNCREDGYDGSIKA